MNDIVYIHYGHGAYVKPKTIVNKIWGTKPCGGLWASRKDDSGEHYYSWRLWCQRNEFRLDSFDTSFEFTLKENARVLELNDKGQLKDLPKLQPYNQNDQYSECSLDFEKLMEQYDAIEITNISKLYWALYGWDCDCILIMNPDIVEFCHNKKQVDA